MKRKYKFYQGSKYTIHVANGSTYYILNDKEIGSDWELMVRRGISIQQVIKIHKNADIIVASRNYKNARVYGLHEEGYTYFATITPAMVNRILNPSRVLNISELFYYRHLTPLELFFYAFFLRLR